jgi:hypothetical protein
MNSETRSIPNVKVNSIGSKKNRIQVISGFVDLPCWDGYFLEERTIYSKEEKRIKGGRIGLGVDGGINPDGSTVFSNGQVAAYFYIVEHQETIKQVILEKLVSDFPYLLANDYQYYDHEEGGFPPLSEVVPGFDFKDYIGPSSISIMEIEKEDAAYTTWYFGCRWDPEHGFQMIMHKDRVIDLGQDTDIWKVFQDNGTYEQEVEVYKTSTTPPPFSWKKKKWWQFWK